MKVCFIVGNLGANAVRRTTADGRELMTFSVAVSAGKEDTLWFNCVGSFREKVFPFLVKGQNVAVTGDLSLQMYNGRPDITLNIDRLELSGRAPEATQAANNTESAPL